MTGHDHTEPTADALRRRVRELQSLVDNSPDILTRFDRDLRHVFVNAAVERATGRRPEEFLGKTNRELGMPAELCGRWEAVVRSVFETGTPASLQFTFESPGGPRCFVGRFVPEFGPAGRVEQVLGVTTDITDRMRAEDQLRRNHDTFYHLIQNDPFGIYVVDADFRLAQVSAGSRKVFQNVRPLLGRDFADVLRSIWAEPFATEVIDRFRHTLATGEPYAAPNTVERRADIPDVEAYDWKIERITLPDGRYGVVCYFYDATERRQAEEAVRASEARTRTVLESITEAFVAVDADWRFTYLNAEAERVYGVRREELLGKSLWDVFPEALGTPFEREYRRAMARRTPGRVDAAFDRLRGWFEVNIFPVEDGGLSFYFRDVTDRKRAEEALARANESLALAFQVTDSAAWDWDIAAGRVFVSPEYRDLYGLPPDAPVSFDVWLGLVHPDDRGRVADAGRELMDRGEEWDVEFRIVHPARGERWLAGVGRLFRDGDGRPVRFTGVNSDITDRKLAQAEAEEARRILRGIMEHVPEGITVADAPDVTIRMVSRHGLELTGRPPETLTGTTAAAHPATWGILHTDGRTPARPDELPLTRAVRRGEVVTNEEWLLCRPDGRCVPILCNAGPLRDAAGAVIGGVIAFRDVAEFKRIEADLREANRRKDEFLATLAHELRNPLAPIRSGLEILRHSPAGADKVREMMARQLSHMVHLIDDLLDVSRITSGKVVLRKERVRVQAAVELAVEANRPIVEASRHTLHLDVPKEPLWVYADLTRLSQVVGNLLTNAAKYTPEGGRISVAVRPEGRDAVLRVTDTGLGIPKEMLSEVFAMFAQVNRNLDRAQGGLGIGLALVKRLVEMHDGSITAESAGPGRGSTFTVRLPALSAEGPRGAGSGSADQAPRSAPRAGLRILVVDDNRDGAESLAMLLELAGHTTRTAFTGPEAIAAARPFRPELVFLDIGLPGMSGHDVARAFRQDPALAGAKLVALTGWGTEEDKRKSVEAGFDLHLTKPVDAAAVEGVLARFPGGDPRGALVPAGNG